MVPDLGIGIVTRDRRGTLLRALEAIRDLTSERRYPLVVADDGSRDGTREMCLALGLPVVSGPRLGVAGNKNRALAWLHRRTRCQVLLLMEDDAYPEVAGWEQPWIDAGLRHGHVNYHEGFRRSDNQPEGGSGTAEDPWWCRAFGGQCTATSRWAFRRGGYLDPRFVGWGWEHIEWTFRYARLLRGGWGRSEPHLLPCMRGDVMVTWDHTFRDEAESAANREVMGRIAAAADRDAFRPAALDRETARRLSLELGMARRG